MTKPKKCTHCPAIEGEAHKMSCAIGGKGGVRFTATERKPDRSHPMHWWNQPCWREPTEVTQPGFYVLTRTDDDMIPRMVIELDEELRCYENDVNSEPVITWDDECRFFGPIPRCEE